LRLRLALRTILMLDCPPEGHVAFARIHLFNHPLHYVRGFLMTKRLIASCAALAVVGLSQGCGSRPPSVSLAAAATPAAAAKPAGCVGPQCASELLHSARHTEVAVGKDAPEVKGHPLTSVVVTQCNLLVAVYMTMSDGRLLRFDHSATVPADQLLQMAYTASRSERVEVSCNENGAVGFEKHDPI
jgi:hypothetical protein